LTDVAGGMGPAATVDFYRKLIDATPANRDQEHLRVVIWADPTVPDRQQALLSGGEDPTPWLEEGVRRLIGCGAEVLVVPCNTIHAYLPAVIAGKDLEFISIIDATVDALDPSVNGSRIGLLAADAAVASGLYQRALQDAGLEPVLPSIASQRMLMDVIDGVKAGQVNARLREHVVRILSELAADGVEAVIAGCTEVSVVLEEMEPEIRVVDSSTRLALRTLERAWESPRPSTLEPLPRTRR